MKHFKPLKGYKLVQSCDDKGIYIDTGSDVIPVSKPIKGEDYWTEEDKSEIKSYVDEAILGGAW